MLLLSILTELWTDFNSLLMAVIYIFCGSEVYDHFGYILSSIADPQNMDLDTSFVVLLSIITNILMNIEFSVMATLICIL